MDNIDYVEEVKGMIQEIFRGPNIKEPIHFTTSQGEIFMARGREMQFIGKDGIDYLFGGAGWHQYPAKEIYDHIKPRYEYCLEAKKTPKLGWSKVGNDLYRAFTSVGALEVYRNTEHENEFRSYLTLSKRMALEIPFSCGKSDQDYLNEAKVYFEQWVEQEERKASCDISSADVRKTLGGHEDSELFGERGLLAATMKSVKALDEIEGIVYDKDLTFSDRSYRIREILEGVQNKNDQ
jgi:hypothetical protein